jgi:hypothetical protein
MCDKVLKGKIPRYAYAFFPSNPLAQSLIVGAVDFSKFSLSCKCLIIVSYGIRGKSISYSVGLVDHLWLMLNLSLSPHTHTHMFILSLSLFPHTHTYTHFFFLL